MKSQLTQAGLMAAVLMGIAMPAQSGCVANEDRGDPHPDGNGSTQYIVTQRAGSTWQDWIFRGRSIGERAYCPTNSSGPCSYNWGRSRTQGYSTSNGFQINIGPELGRANNNFAHAVASAGYNRTWTRWNETTQSFEWTVQHDRGTYAEPIIVQNRRWTKGYMRGAWYLTSTTRDRFNRTIRCYGWNGNRSFGIWVDNRAEGSPYRSMHIHR